MAGMKQIEAAIGEADAQPRPTPFVEALVEHCPVEHDLLLGREGGGRKERARSSAAEAVAVPRLPTTTAAAALAARMAGSKPEPTASIAANTATTVSPAPDTSRTLTG